MLWRTKPATPDERVKAIKSICNEYIAHLIKEMKNEGASDAIIQIIEKRGPLPPEATDLVHDLPQLVERYADLMKKPSFALAVDKCNAVCEIRSPLLEGGFYSLKAPEEKLRLCFDKVEEHRMLIQTSRGYFARLWSYLVTGGRKLKEIDNYLGISPKK